MSQNHIPHDKVTDFGFKELEIGDVYSQWIYSIFEPYVGHRVLEVGCGLGLMARHFQTKKLVILSDVHKKYLSVVNKRYKNRKNVRVMRLDIEKVQDKQLTQLKRRGLDTVLSINVLEHIENDISALKNVHAILVSGGRIVFFVPALEQIFGSLDEAFGHYRRYTRNELIRKLELAGFSIELIRPFNFIGIFWWFMTGRILKKRNLPPLTGKLLHLFVPLLEKIEAIIPIPIGQSFIVVARKQDLPG